MNSYRGTTKETVDNYMVREEVMQIKKDNLRGT